MLFLILFFLSCPDVLSHPLCYDGSGPNPRPLLNYCTEYRASSCCSVARELTEVTNFYNLNVGHFSSGFLLNSNTTWSICDRELLKVACTKCSPYESHVYETSSSFPLLCSDKYCATTFASACPGIQCSSVGIVSTDPWCYPIVDA